ncbi:MAG: hypothetical protein IJ593_06275 [Lachnospiraceae bacterium]|nr:hypothetical protein [Lachnospiraceae bacterium]
MKTKIVLIILTLLMLVSICGCAVKNTDSGNGNTVDEKPEEVSLTDENKNTVDNVENNNQENVNNNNENVDNIEIGNQHDTDKTETSENLESVQYIEGTDIRKNGYFEKDITAITASEKNYYYGEALKALKNLDFENIKLYFGENEASRFIKELHCIADDEPCRELWNNVIGEIVYFEDTGVLAAHSANYIFAKWYTEKIENNAELPESTELVEFDETLDAYNKYFNDSPYVAGKISNVTYLVERIDNGYIIFSTDSFLQPIGYTMLDSIYNEGSDGQLTRRMAPLIFGNNFSLTDEYGSISDADNIPDYEVLLPINLDKVCEVIDAYYGEPETYDNYEVNTKYGLKYTYAPYIKDETNRKIFQSWINENVETLRTVRTIEIWYPLDAEKLEADGFGVEAIKFLKTKNFRSRIIVDEFPQDYTFLNAMETLVYEMEEDRLEVLEEFKLATKENDNETNIENNNETTGDKQVDNKDELEYVPPVPGNDDDPNDTQPQVGPGESYTPAEDPGFVPDTSGAQDVPEDLPDNWDPIYANIPGYEGEKEGYDFTYGDNGFGYYPKAPEYVPYWVNMGYSSEEEAIQANADYINQLREEFYKEHGRYPAPNELNGGH